MAEARELIDGWADYPPTNLLLKAIFEGLGGGKKKETAPDDNTIPPEAQAAMERSALSEIAAKAGRRIPIIGGRDKGLPKAKPIFDVDAMRAKNEAKATAFRQGGTHVGQ